MIEVFIIIICFFHFRIIDYYFRMSFIVGCIFFVFIVCCTEFKVLPQNLY